MTNHLEQFQYLFDYLEQFVKFSDDEKQQFAPFINVKYFKKGEIITAIGAVEDSVYFISKGIIRNYCIKDVEEFTYHFDFSNAFVSSYTSFVERSPSLLGIQALTDVQAYHINYEHLQLVFESSKQSERMGRLIAEQMSGNFETRLIDMLTKTALERYEYLLKNEPHLILSVPQKYIAEYLGIQPESLSRLKKQVAK